MLKPLHIVLAAVLILLLGGMSAVVASPVRFSGFLEWRYGEHSGKEGNQTVIDASHFTQEYTVLANKRGLLKAGRLGKYDLSLGYEWASVDAYSGNHVKVDIDNPLDKILYKGDITIAPGGLPFSLNAYSYDLNSTSYGYESNSSEFANIRGEAPDRWDTIADISNGTHKVTGVILQAGVSNGHYEGRYRDALSTMPRLLIDYRESDVKDVNGPNKRDYIDRDLAFVSLNKKNNWFHYKVYTHEDRIDPATNYREQLFLLGTINHRSQREWVNLTNWIQISSDISYSETLPAPSLKDDLNKRYDLNIFAKAQRTRWEGSSFTSYRRSRDGDSLDKFLYIPFFAQGVLNRDTSWRFRLISSQDESAKFTGLNFEENKDIFASTRVETFKQARYIVSPLVEAEAKSGTKGEGTAGRIGMEIYSNAAYRSPYDMFGGFELAYFNGTSETSADVDYLESTLTAKLEKDINAILRGGVEQRFVFGHGVYDSTVADNIVARSQQLIDFTERSEVFRTTTSAFLDLRNRNGLQNYFSATFDAQSGGNGEGNVVKVGHDLRYDRYFWSLMFASQAGYSNGDSDFSTGGINPVDGARAFLTNQSRISYSPNRVYQVSGNFGFSIYDHRTGSNTERYYVREQFEYSIWNTRGYVRKLAVLGQEINFEQTDAQSSADDSFGFSLFSDLYPTRKTLLSAKLRYDFRDASKGDIFTCYLSAGVNFMKLKVSADYSYGIRPSTDTLLERKEQRFEVKIKKLF